MIFYFFLPLHLLPLIGAASDDDREREDVFSLFVLFYLARLSSLSPLREWPRARRRAPGAPALSLALERRGRKKKESSSLKSKSPNLSAFGPLQMQRVKVYRLNPEGLWDDKGTGSVSVENLEVWVAKRRAERLDERTDRLTSSVAVEFAVSSIFFFFIASIAAAPVPLAASFARPSAQASTPRSAEAREHQTRTNRSVATLEIRTPRSLGWKKTISPPFSPSLPFPSRTRPLNQNHNSNPTRPGSSSSRRRTPGRS